MVDAVAPAPSRRLPLWVIIAAPTACVLTGVFVLLWFKLPTWAPEWVVEHSPWVDPIVRAVEADHRQNSTAVMVLAKMRPYVTWKMAGYLGNGHQESRPFAAQCLRSSIDPEAFDALLSFINDGDSRIIDEVLSMLEEDRHRDRLVARRSSIVPVLINHLSHKDPSVCRQSAKLLGVLRDSSAVDALINRLRGALTANGAEAEVQRAVIGALGEIGDGRSVAPLLSLLTRDASEAIRAAGNDYVLAWATIALVKHPAHLLTPIILPLPENFDECWKFDAASRSTELRVMAALDEALRRPSESEETEWDRLVAGGRGAAAASSLAKINHPEAYRLLTTALADSQALIRRRSVLGITQTFGHGVDPRLVLSVQAALLDSEDDVRFAAAFGYRFLTKHLSPRPVEDLLIKMASVEDIKRRRIALAALGSPDVTEHAVLCLLAYAGDNDESVRSSAWMSLAKTGSALGVEKAAKVFPAAGIKEKKHLLLCFVNGGVVDSSMMSLITIAIADQEKSVRELADKRIFRLELTTGQWRTIEQARLRVEPAK